MFYKRFRFQIIFRVLILCLTVYALFHLIILTKFYTTAFVTLVFIIYQVISLIRYVEKTNQQLSRFLLAMKYGDFSQNFSAKGLGASFEELVSLFNDVIKKTQQIRYEKEENYHYLQTILHHVGIGLLTFREDGEIDLVNKAAKRLLKVARLKNINSLREFNPPLVDTLFSLKAGEKSLVKIENGEMELIIHAAEFRLKDHKYTLVSLQDIQGELQEKEMEAWQTLIRVLTHEIMNSMTPITSMAATVIDLMKSLYNQEAQGAEKSVDPDTTADIESALKTIHKRSQGLTEFVGAYRNLTLIPKPSFRIFTVEELFARVEKLMEQKFRENNIQLHWSVEPQTLELTADPGLIEQVLINLLLNAVDALEVNAGQKEPRVEMSGELDEIGRVLIRVVDNGPGIVEEAQKKVFIPFFTTKKKGSGIGLSISRQIMKLHKGAIMVHS
ncbi:MAG: two-component system, NtrC family, nitrogen regulation sensor histidine kinase NtrY, partial [Acidobacteriota bacterium]|nr:two-component system, NtrC family, nitrogen regulation sensor histidine kinase NtrY [Acidobacteriota bacterium]